jgi:predicted O-methyltransferase YrrM
MIDPNWTNKFSRNMLPLIAGWNDRPIQYMEIGVYKGDTSRWVLDNALRHKSSTLVGIDPWNSIKNPYTDMDWDKLKEGLKEISIKYSPRVQWITGRSCDILRNIHFENNHYDLIYIDGDHYTLPVLHDFFLTWPLLKIGGIMVFDDYRLRVIPAVDMVLAGLHQLGRRHISRRYDLLFKNNQVGIRKVRDL